MHINRDFIHNVIDAFYNIKPHGSDLCAAARAAYDQQLYGDLNSQIVYALRFIPAYYFEYCAMVADLNARVRDFAALSVASFGCGLCPDYYALRDNLNIPFRYVGFDSIEWESLEYMPPVDGNWSGFARSVEDIDVDELHKFDAFVFPKSITDIDGCSDDCLSKLADKISATKKKRIFFLNSYVKKKFESTGFIQPFLKVHSRLQAAGFVCQDDIYKTFRVGHERQGLKKIHTNFDYPNGKILTCEQIDEGDNNCKNCNAPKKPILMNTHMSYAVIEYKK